MIILFIYLFILSRKIVFFNICCGIYSNTLKIIVLLKKH